MDKMITNNLFKHVLQNLLGNKIELIQRKKKKDNKLQNLKATSAAT